MELDSSDWWTLNVDGALLQTGASLGLQFKALTEEFIEQAICLNFHASNNKAEYEATIVRLDLAISVSTEKNHHKKRLSIAGQAGKQRV